MTETARYATPHQDPSPLEETREKKTTAIPAASETLDSITWLRDDRSSMGSPVGYG